MLFTIITATFNAADSVERNVRSVAGQGCDVQHLIVDNCSTDGTLDRVNAYHCPHIEIICEKDNGIYDAFNKGIARARGDVVAVLNADDYYLPGTLIAVREVFEQNHDITCVHGNTETEKNGRPVTFRPRNGFGSFGGVRVFHPTFFCRREVFERVGTFNARYRIAADLDFFLRAQKQFPFTYLDRTLTHFSLGGISTQQRFRVSNEVFAVARSHGFGFAHCSLVWLTEVTIKVAASVRSSVT